MRSKGKQAECFEKQQPIYIMRDPQSLLRRFITNLHISLPAFELRFPLRLKGANPLEHSADGRRLKNQGQSDKTMQTASTAKHC